MLRAYLSLKIFITHDNNLFNIFFILFGVIEKLDPCLIIHSVTCSITANNEQ